MFGNHGLGGLLEEGAHGKFPKCLGGNLGDLQRSQAILRNCTSLRQCPRDKVWQKARSKATAEK